VSKNTYLNAEQTYLQAKLSLALYYQLLQFYQGNQIQI
jgi:outer membrane protein